MEANVGDARKSRDAVEASLKRQIAKTGQINAATAAFGDRVQTAIILFAFISVGLGILVVRVILSQIRGEITRVGHAMTALAGGT